MEGFSEGAFVGDPRGDTGGDSFFRVIAGGLISASSEILVPKCHPEEPF